MWAFMQIGWLIFKRGNGRAFGFRPRYVFCFLSFFSFAAIVPAAQAQDWDVGLKTEVRASFSDNVTLVNEGQISDLVLAAAPSLTVRRTSKRLQFAADYDFDYLYFTRDGATDTRHGLTAIADFEAVENTLFLSARASLRESFLDRRQALSSGIDNRSDNRRLVQNYIGQARLVGNLGRFAAWQASYRYGATLSPADNLDDPQITTNFSDSYSHELQAEIYAGRDFGRLGWRLFLEGNRVERSLSAQNFKNDRVGAEISYQFTRALQGRLGGGQSANDLQSGGLSEDGRFFYGGLRYTPTSRTIFDLETGQDGNRQTWNVRLQHRLTRRIDISFSYRDQIAASSLVDSQALQGVRLDANGNLIGPDGRILSSNNTLFSFSDADFRRQSYNGTINWRGKRSQLALSFGQEDRQFDNGAGTATSENIALSWQRRLNERMTLEGQASYQKSRFEGDDRLDENIAANLNIRRRLAENVDMVLRYSYGQRFSTDNEGNLRENAISFSLTASF